MYLFVNANFTTSETFSLYYWLMGCFFKNREEDSENEPPHKQSKQQGAEGGIDDIEVQYNNATCSSFKVSKTNFFRHFDFLGIVSQKWLFKIIHVQNSGVEGTLFLLCNFVFLGVTMFFGILFLVRDVGSKIQY